MGKTKFALIERDQIYTCNWNTEELNQNDFKETGNITFSIENWLFLIHPVTKVGRWLRRQDLPRKTPRQWFRVLNRDNKNGNFTFKQTARESAQGQFGISVIVLKKQTENLEIIYTSSLLSFVPQIMNFTGREATRQFCINWNAKTKEIVKPENLTKCPCTLESAKMNPNLFTDFTCSATETDCHENLNAHRCFLRKVDNNM